MQTFGNLHNHTISLFEQLNDVRLREFLVVKNIYRMIKIDTDLIENHKKIYYMSLIGALVYLSDFRVLFGYLKSLLFFTVVPIL